jgi:hypothetical protein
VLDRLPDGRDLWVVLLRNRRGSHLFLRAPIDTRCRRQFVIHVHCRVQYSLANISVIYGQTVRPDRESLLKLAMIGLVVNEDLTDVAANCYCRTCFGHGLQDFE